MICRVTGVHGPSRHSVAVFAGGVLYLAGSVGVTAAYHVPLNNALTDLGPQRSRNQALWQDYLQRWTAGNHLRTIGCSAAAALYLWALAAGNE